MYNFQFLCTFKKRFVNLVFNIFCYGFNFCLLFSNIWYLVILSSLLYELAKFSSPFCKVHVVQLPCPHSQVGDSTLPRQHCQIAKPTSSYALHEWSSSSRQTSKFVGCPVPELFLVCSNFWPKRKTALDLFSPQASPPLPPPNLSLSFPSLSFCVFGTWWLFEAWDLSKIQTTLWTCWTWLACAKLHSKTLAFLLRSMCKESWAH